MKYRNICRENALTFSIDFISSLLPARVLHVLFLLLPAFVIGCRNGEFHDNDMGAPLRHTISVKAAKRTDKTIDRADVFVYEDDPIGRLDCYQRFSGIEDGVCEVSSCSGGKTIFMLCNFPTESYEYQDICSISAIGDLRIRIEDDDPKTPVMTCLSCVEAGGKIMMHPKPIMSEVHLRSISCDFSKESYQGRVLTDIKVYLTNVNAEWRLSDLEGDSPERIINAGGLRENDIAGFARKEMIVHELGAVGQDVAYPGRSLYCYPNSAPEESIGTPYTKLVIEGKIDGDTYWYPIEINRDSQGKGGIGRNMSYVYDIRIRRTGLTSPEGRLEDKMMDVKMQIRNWEEKEWYDVRF